MAQGIGGVLEIPDDLGAKLENIDKKLERIADTSEKLQRQFVASMRSSGDSLGQVTTKIDTLNTSLNNIDFSKLSGGISTVGISSQGATQSIEQMANALVKAVQELGKLNDGSSSGEAPSRSIVDLNEELSKTPRTINEIKENLKNLKKAVGDVDLGKDLSDTKGIERANARIIELDRSMKKLKQTVNVKSSFSTAMSMDESTINQRIAKIRELERVRKGLDDKDKNYAETLSNLNAKMRDLRQANADAIKGSELLRKSHSKLMDTARQLARRMALIFSVSQITGYVRDMVNVRKEFELQQVALQAILQNKQQANALFSQITQLAVQSPYTIKELITYTKQLAAYRIETEKLYGTTKMLADVAAGVGVDMQRLILAFGQVKAANYLRGQELRQFSEAGINILGELAKKFSQVKGEIVSVGEVMEMVSNRKVTFTDVEDVFKTLTEDGGIFYNMQEKQANTLYGRISNLRDTIDLMFNDIGKANDGVLNGTLDVLKSIVQNWDKILPIVEGVITAFITYKTLKYAVLGYEKLSLAYTTLMNKGVQQVTASQGTLNAVTKANPYIIILTTLITIVATVSEWYSYQKNLTDEINKISSSGLQEYAESSATFERLANIVSDVTKTYKEQSDALKELQRRYGDMLPTQLLTMEGIRALKGEYQSATDAIYAYIDAKTKEEQANKIREAYAGDISDAVSEVESRLMEKFKLTKTQAAMVASEIQKLFTSGQIRNMDEYANKLAELVNGLGVAKVNTQEFYLGVESGVGQYRALFDLLSEEKNAINGLNEANYRYKDAQVSGYEATKAWITERTNLIKTDLQLINELQRQKDTSGGVLPDVDQQKSDALKKEVEGLFTYIGYSAEQAKEIISNAASSTIWVDYGAIQYAEKAINNFFNNIKNKSQTVYSQKWIENLSNEISQFSDENTKKINQVFLSFANAHKDIDMAQFGDFLKKPTETMSEYRDRISDILKDLTQQMAMFAQFGYVAYDPQKAQAYKLFIEEAAKKASIMAGNIPTDTKKTKSGSSKDPQKEMWENRIKVIKDANQEYEKLRKTMSDVEATAKIKSIFGDVFKGAKLDKILDLNKINFSDAGSIESLEKVLDMLPKKYSKSITELKRSIAVMKRDLETEANEKSLEKAQKEIDSLFSGYELSIEMEKSGLDSNLIYQLLGVDTFSLDKLKEKIQPQIDKWRKENSEESIKKAEETEKKLKDLDAKALQERAKNYAKYIKQSIAERTQIELEYQKKMAEVESAKEYTPEQRANIERALNIQKQSALSKTIWEDFKNSEMYIKMFEDLEYVSTNTLKTLKAQLEDMRGSLSNLDPTQLKEITSQMQKIDEQINTRSSFKSLIPDIKKYIAFQKQRGQIEKDFIRASTNVKNLKDRQTSQEIVIGDLESQYAKEVKINGVNSDQAKLIKMKLEMERATLNVIITRLESEGKITAEKAKQLRNGESEGKSLSDKFNKASQYTSELNSAFNSITDSLQSIFGEFDEGTQEIIGSISTVLDGIGTVEDGISDIINGKVFTGVVKTVRGVFKTIGGLFGIGNRDKRLEKQIQEEVKQVSKLQRAYEKLGKAIEDAYSMNTLKESNKMAMQNIEAQISSYRKMISAEQGKKKTDSDKITEYRNAIEDLYQQEKELREKYLEDLGGFGSESNMKSAAQEFVDAWFDAFNETGDGLSGLEDKWDDYYDNIIKKQMMLRYAQQYLKPLFNAVDKMFAENSESGENVTKGELDSVTALSETLLPSLSDALGKFANSIGYVGDSARGSLSGLTQSIQGITESTAEALEALLNSTRFFVSDSNSILRNIHTAFTSFDGTNNPTLAELRLQTVQITGINRLLGSVVKGGNGGQRIKVEIL